MMLSEAQTMLHQWYDASK